MVIFQNGDRLTGEVKSLERGRLRFDTDATGIVAIQWDEVAYLSSEQNIQVELTSGVRYLGTISNTDRESALIVNSDFGSSELDLGDIVLMTPIEEQGVANRLDGRATAGYNFTKASEVSQLNLGLDLSFRTETRIIGLNASTIVSDSEDNDSSQRANAEFSYQYLMANRWYRQFTLNLTRNDELGVDIRSSLGAALGRYIYQTNQRDLKLDAGVYYTQENLSSGSSLDDSIELYSTITFDWFRYDYPELDFSTSFQLIPSVTEKGRIRSELDINLRWEIFDDLFWDLTFYNSYNNEPVEETGVKNDYGIITSLGWSI